MKREMLSPEAFLGHRIGEDFFLADYTQLVGYWRMLDADSDRVSMIDIGATGYGRRQFMLVISSARNLAEVERYREIAAMLAAPDALSRDDARKLAHEGKAIVFIDGGVHHNEILPTQTLIEFAWRMASGDDAETLRILDEVILLLVHANPDGHEDFAREYMRETDPARRPVEWRFAMPELMPRYAGSDINRDYHFGATAETRNVARVMYRRWFPQIAYDPHQTGPLGAAMYVPPFRDPNNAFTAPLVLATSGELGMAVHHRLIAEGKGGAYMQNAAPYTAWTNGMSTTTAHLHNVIGILSEVIGTPHPQRVPFVPARHLPGALQPIPLEPQIWHASTTIDYQVSAHYAVLDWAACNRERLLMATYATNRAAIDAGNRDTWTTRAGVHAALIDATRTRTQTQTKRTHDAFDRASGIHIGNLRGGVEADPADHARWLRAPDRRDPRGFVIRADQADFPNAVAFVNVLIRGGVRVERATEAFKTGAARYPAGSFLVRLNQPYRPFVLDMFEPQQWPSAPLFAGGPIELPYDAAGYTVALQMGVSFDRVLDGFDGPFELLDDEIDAPCGHVVGLCDEDGDASRVVGFVVDCECNVAFRLVNELIADGFDVRRIREPVDANGKTLRAGAFWIAAGPATAEETGRRIVQFGIDAHACNVAPVALTNALTGRRIAIYSKFGGIRSAGFLQRVLDEFGFSHTLLYPGELRTGAWRAAFDVLVLTDGAISKCAGPSADEEPVDEAAAYVNMLDSAPLAADSVPAAYHHMLGDLDAPESIAQIRAFLNAGGAVIGVGSGVHIASRLECAPAPHTGDHYIALSVVRANLDTRHPLAWGLGDTVNLVFDHSPVFRTLDDDRFETVCRFDDPTMLLSGFALREAQLQGAAAIVCATVGQGRLTLIGPEVNFRAQTMGAIKLLFNAFSETLS